MHELAGIPEDRFSTASDRSGRLTAGSDWGRAQQNLRARNSPPIRWKGSRSINKALRIC